MHGSTGGGWHGATYATGQSSTLPGRGAPGVVCRAADARGDRRVPAGGSVLGRRGAAARSRRRRAGAHPTTTAASVRRTGTLFGGTSPAWSTCPVTATPHRHGG